ncbi:MAG: hypothetical protein LBU81_00770 [Methanosarcinales archaeon]|jgi:hypothetical protein|nr:hypothetical protein [Methanosarcinales archaeon]
MIKFIAESMDYVESVRLEKLLNIFKIEHKWDIGGCGSKPFHCEFEINFEDKNQKLRTGDRLIHTPLHHVRLPKLRI